MAEENEDTTDITIAGGLATAGLLSDDGLAAMQQVLGGSQDPAAAIGNAVFQALGKVREKLEQQGISINDKLWVANGGVLDRVLFEVIAALKAILGFEQAGSAEFSSAVKGTVIQLMEQQDSQGEAPMEQAPMPAPEQGMPQEQPTGLLGAM